MSQDAGQTGPLTKRVLAYVRAMKDLVARVGAPSDWAPLEEFVTVGDFERIGVFLDVQDWQQYTEMLTQWASSIDSFDTSVRRISETSNLVYYEIEERHHRGGIVNVVNSLSVFSFDDSGKIRHLDVYLQQPPPLNS